MSITERPRLQRVGRDHTTMYTKDDLDSAVAEGVLTRELAERFQAHVANKNGSRTVDDEQFRLISGFNDVFVVIACVLTLVSTFWIGTAITAWLAFVATALVAWVLSEIFVRRRRMALPAIVLLGAFTGCVVACAVWAVTVVSSDYAALTFFSGLAAAALAAWVHWLRFRVPLAVAISVGASLLFGALLVLIALPDGGTVFNGSSLARFGGPVSFVCGLLAFILAMRWDMGDRERRNEKSDVAFWLHMLAAPLLVHPVFSAMTIKSADGASIWQAAAVVALYLGIGVVSLAIDRRALMVAALSYVLAVFASVLYKFGMVDFNFALTALLVGAALLVLSSFWHRLRVVVVRWLPTTLTERLPPL